MLESILVPFWVVVFAVVFFIAYVTILLLYRRDLKRSIAANRELSLKLFREKQRNEELIKKLSDIGGKKNKPLVNVGINTDKVSKAASKMRDAISNMGKIITLESLTIKRAQAIQEEDYEEASRITKVIENIRNRNV